MTYSQEQIDSAIVYALGKLGVENLKNKWLEVVENFVNSSDGYDGSTASALPPFPLGHDPSSMYTQHGVIYAVHTLLFTILQGR